MMRSYEYFIGLRYLLSKKKQAFLSVISWISVLGIAVGVMALTIVLSAVSGFQEDFRKRILGNNAPLIVFNHEGNIYNYEPVYEDIMATSGVTGANPFVYGEVLMVSETGRSSGGVIYGVNPDRVKNVTSLNDDMNRGKLEDLKTTSGLPGIILGNDIAENQLFVSVGSTISIVSPEGELSPFGFGPKLRKFEVVGTFKSGLFEFDTKSAYVLLEDAQSFLGVEDAVAGIQVMVKDYERNAKPVAVELYKNLGSSFYVRHWMELNKDLFNAFKLEKTVFFIVVVMIVLVASFNIISTLTLLVLTKAREISILKTLGATRKSIAKIFMFCGFVLGALGTLLGLALGVFGCYMLEHHFPFPLNANVYQVDHLPIRIDALEWTWVGLCALSISFLSTLYPAFKASQLEPSEGIRHDI